MPDVTPLLVLALQAALLAAVVEGVRRWNPAVMVNAIGALAVALLPAALHAATPGTSTAFTPVVTLWIAAAGLLHSLGMLGLYESRWWWDHLAHTVSGALVAALAYTGIVIGVDAGYLPAFPGGVAAATVGFVALVAVAWELLELVAREIGDRFDIDPVLVHYGWRDTALDLAFTLGGAILVVTIDLRLYLPIADAHPGPTAHVITWVGVAVAAASIVMGIGLLATR